MKKIVIALFAILTIMASSAFAEIIDEGRQGKASLPTESGGNMQRSNKYLKSFQKRFESSAETENINDFDYNEKKIIKVQLRVNMQTNIIFPEGEQIVGFSLGDPINFSFVPNPKDSSLANVALSYANLPGADTNLNVFGKSGNVYSLYLRNYPVTDDAVAPDFIIRIHDNTVKERVRNALADDERKEAEASGICLDCEKRNMPPEQATKFDKDYLRSLPTAVKPENINLGYATSKGAEELSPLKIFDDGYWTYFQYDANNFDKMSGVPVIYKVIDGFDTLVNTRISGGTIIAETVSDKWTIRRGDAFLCVRTLEK